MFEFISRLFGIKSDAEKKLDERARLFEEKINQKIESGEWVHRDAGLHTRGMRAPEENNPGDIMHMKGTKSDKPRKHPRYSKSEPSSNGDSND